MNQLLADLSAFLDSGGILTGNDVSSRAPGWSHKKDQQLESSILIRPKDTQQVSAVLKLCHRYGQSVVTQGGKTGLTGATISTPNDIILSLERMNTIEDIDCADGTMTVQAGVALATIQEQAATAGFMFPMDLGARGTATIGGNIATNAGGNRVIRYGMTRQLVLGLEVVLADGTIIESLNRVIKNNTGYDLKHLFIGSEGTLGIITRAVLKLSPSLSSQNTALVALESFDKVISLLDHCKRNFSSSLSAFEVMWDSFYQVSTGSGPAAKKSPLADTHPFYAIVETLGNDQTKDQQHFEQVLEQQFERDIIEDAVLAKSHNEREAIWAIRDNIESTSVLAPAFTFDISLPIVHMQESLEAIKPRLHSLWPNHSLCVFGHLGDGNLHLLIAVGSSDTATHNAINEIVYSEVKKWSGSISAEHGIGLEKRDYLHYSRKPAEISLMRTIKAALDPDNLLNPGKIFAEIPSKR
jgi:FAD/FMN-containing dehydrogenase